MMKKRSVLPILALSACLLVACLPMPENPNVLRNQFPTEAPTATSDPLATSTPAVPEGFYATQQANSQATIEVRATASPFPTALPGHVRQGQPASALGQRDGLSMEVRLPKDTYLAGEGGQAEVEIRNTGPETVYIDYGRDMAGLSLVDSQGRAPEVWPFSFTTLLSGPPYLQKLSPGDRLTKTLAFQVPPSEQTPPGLLNLWTETRFSRTAPDHPDGPDNLWMRLEAGPLVLHIQAPEPAQTLQVDWQVDRSGWRLYVEDTQGQVPAGPFWGEIGMASPNALCAGPLPANQARLGEWTGTWEPNLQLEGVQVITQGWIAAPGYVTAVFSQTLPGQGDAQSMLGLPATAPERLSFSTIAAAQSGLDFPIYALAPHLNTSTLETVQVEKRSGDQDSWTTVEQQVRLPGGSWVVLTQMATTASYASAGWRLARYDFEARQMDMHGQTAYAVQRFGWWYLDWKVGEMGFELRAPMDMYPLENLLEVARQLRER